MWARIRRGRNRRPAAWAGAATAVALMLAGCSGVTAGSTASPVTTPQATVTIQTHRGAPGTYLVDGSGLSLYMWEADASGITTCYGACAVDWPPLTVTGSAVAGPGVQANLIGSTTRKDGTKQVTYNGWPLYYFIRDTAPGDLAGQGDPGFGAVWWVLSPSGAELPSAPIVSTTGG